MTIRSTNHKRICIIPIIGIFFKFILFNIIWCSYTTFTPFSGWELYVTALTAALILGTPYVLSRRIWVGCLIMGLLDLWMIANLMYYRTYFSTIPPSSYFLAGNLADFLPSVADSLRWNDILFPLSTVVTFLWTRKQAKEHFLIRTNRRNYFSVLVCFILFLSINFTCRGGFLTLYRGLLSSAHKHASGPALYTLFGTLYYDYTEETATLSEEQKQEVLTWLTDRPKLQPLEGLEERDNCIFIFVESLESWVLNCTVEGQEIMPNLNRLIKDSTTLYAPHVVTQVNGGRSIDGQLLALTGLLPLQTGAYSCRFPFHTYPSLPKALKERKNTRNYLLTVDKPKTWNQGIIAKSFGIDSIISYENFKMTEAFGNRKRLGDKAFFEQCKEKMENGEIWKTGEHAYIQLVTYSGHSPFKIPEELRTVHFSKQIPEVMNDYMSVVHYTDDAIGKFVEYLKTRPEYNRTLIVITGDHEGLADKRSSLCRTKAGRGVVADKEFTPFIVLNAPKAMHYTSVMGQVDMYPTLLNLLGLENYRWTGLGQSIFDSRKKPMAIDVKRDIVVGDTLGISRKEIQRLHRSPIISDRIIRFDLLQGI